MSCGSCFHVDESSSKGEFCLGPGEANRSNIEQPHWSLDHDLEVVFHMIEGDDY